MQIIVGIFRANEGDDQWHHPKSAIRFLALKCHCAFVPLCGRKSPGKVDDQGPTAWTVVSVRCHVGDQAGDNGASPSFQCDHIFGLVCSNYGGKDKLDILSNARREKQLGRG